MPLLPCPLANTRSACAMKTRNQLIDKLVHVALQCSVAAGGVRVEPTARLDGEVGRLLHRLHREIAGRLEDDGALATDPGNNGRPVFVIMASTGLTLPAAASPAASQ